jgi:hypothetical protein
LWTNTGRPLAERPPAHRPHADAGPLREVDDWLARYRTIVSMGTA